MRRYLGTVLLVLGGLGILATLFLIAWQLTHPFDHPSRDRRQTEAMVFAVIVGFLVVLESLLLLAGLYLRRFSKPPHDEAVAVRGRRRVCPFVLYLGASIGIGLLGALAFLRHIHIGPLWLLVSPPAILFQIACAPFDVKLAPGLTRGTLLTLFYVLYFMALLYPVYRMFTLDRTRERVRIRHMKIAFVLLCTLHLLAVFFLAVVTRA